MRPPQCPLYSTSATNTKIPGYSEICHLFDCDQNFTSAISLFLWTANWQILKFEVRVFIIL